MRRRWGKTVQVIVNERTFNINEKERSDNRVILEVDGVLLELETVPVAGMGPSTTLVRVGQRLLFCRRVDDPGGGVEAWVNERALRVELVNRQTTLNTSHLRDVSSNEPITVEAPMAGRIVEVKASTGLKVKEGQPLVVLEAMKMENEIAAPRDGTVKEVFVKEKSLVKPGDKLVVLD